LTLDAQLWHSQFGFRCRRSTEDAVFAARRQVKLAVAQRRGQISLLALDWSKALDSVHVKCLLDALRWIGLPQSIVSTMASLMYTRAFFVEDCNSTVRPQRSGISQGCTISPLLFPCVMTVGMADAVSNLSPEAQAAYQRNDLLDLVFADDTLLLGVSAAHLSEFLSVVTSAGQSFSLW